jgi:2-oxoisovalerate dehydrogenase E1 component
LIAEIMGKSSGVCGGMGGSQHLHAADYYSNGILGGMVPIAAGGAFASKLKGNNTIAVVFLGDGALGEGVLYEALNLASKWSLPLLLVVENNRYAQSTPNTQTLAGTIEGRATAFSIAYQHANTWAWKALLKEAVRAVDYVRESGSPMVLEIETYRLKAHSKGDDNRKGEEIAEFWKKDPLVCLMNSATPQVASTVSEVDREIEMAVQAAEASSECAPQGATAAEAGILDWCKLEFPEERIADATYASLREWLETVPAALMLGEDIEGPYGGAFKITRDLSQLFPGRVRNTPISEAAITGVATGLALRGFRPLVEIMFGDFTTLILDQLLQHACKFRSMYGGRVSVPLVVRTPMGGRRGYGPTHSQSLERLFLGIQNLKVLAVNHRVPVRDLYHQAFAQDDPVLLIENKILYTRKQQAASPLGFELAHTTTVFPDVRIGPSGRKPVITITCYGGMLEEAEKAAQRLFDDDEICAEIICPVMIQPFDARALAASVGDTEVLLTCEEGSSTGGFGAEALSRVQMLGVSPRRFHKLGFEGVIPSAFQAERRLLPGADQIVEAARKLLL